ncbi:hypothetical protein BSL78_07668 [Apostichopus japonicus]|uniref:Protein XRP2 n=1 Tax=Stichopus japonicus TaxID=307972 RepID=A0A2G8L5N1_STIJA|nr:hypothetical protein BSL78_07668 [Apostichopus japonicus]
MGCLFSKGSDQGEGKEEEEAPKTYSWDTKDRPDPKDFTIEGLKGETAGRVPGTVNGQQFIINNCQDSCIYIFDHSASVTVDNCTGCKIFIGPSKGSVFLRNCSQCKMVLACQQFRSRDCKSVDILLHCDTQPIIESSTKIRFGCFQYSYPELRDQFQKRTKVEDVLPVPETEQFSQMTVSTDVNDSFVPLSHGKRRKPADESCLILFFHIDNGDETMKKFILNLKNEESVLIESKQLELHYEDVCRIFGELPHLKEVTKSGSSLLYAYVINHMTHFSTESYFTISFPSIHLSLFEGPVTALQFNGKDVVQKCQAFVKDLATNVPTYVSGDPDAAKKDIENWRNFVEAQFSM